MTRLFLSLVFACVLLGGNAWADEAKERCATVQRGDNLTRIARELNSTVPDLVAKNGIKDQNRIYPGQKICLGEAKDFAQDQKNQQPKSKAMKKAEASVNGDIPEGYTPYAETGVNPLIAKKSGDAKMLLQIERDALLHIGVAKNGIAFIEQSLINGTAEESLLQPGTKFVSMSEHGKGKNAVKITRNRIATWTAPERAVVITLPDGRKMARMNSCSNWAQVEVEPQPESIAIAAVTPKPEESPEEEGIELCGLDDHDAFLSTGRTDGNGSKTRWNYASGFACIAKGRVDGGTVKAGAGGVYGNHKGHATTDGFQYSGNRYAWGPEAKYVDDDGWDARVGFFPWGKFSNDGKSADGDYVQTRDFGMRGVDLGINLYQREMSGEEWFPKTQIYGSYFKLFAKDVHHSWQGKSIADTSDLKSSALLSVGVRQFIYQGPVKPWFSLEYFSELPSVRNLTGMIGVTDEDEILWAGIGLTRNLEKGGIARSWMLGVDVGNGIRKVRSDMRHDEWVATETSYYDEETGAFTTKKPGEGDDVIPSSSSPSIARFDVANGQFVRSINTPVSKPAVVDKMDQGQGSQRVTSSVATGPSEGVNAPTGELDDRSVAIASQAESDDPWGDSWAQK